MKFKFLKMWYARYFKVISNEQAIDWGLIHFRNIYGDEINHMNCRSIWCDDKDRFYRVKHIMLNETNYDEVMNQYQKEKEDIEWLCGNNVPNP